jgi:hypothetical protein
MTMVTVARCGRDQILETLCGGMGIGGTDPCGPRADSLASAGHQRLVLTSIRGGMKRDPQLQEFELDDDETATYRASIPPSGAGLPGPYCCYSRCMTLHVGTKAVVPQVPPTHQLGETCIPPPVGGTATPSSDPACPAAIELQGVMRPYRGAMAAGARGAWWLRTSGGKSCCYTTVVPKPRPPILDDPHCPTCKCAAAGTRIATPSGEVAIETLAPGDVVISMHEGRLQPVKLAAVHREPVRDHVVVVATLASGRTVAMSPQHPTGDGHTFADLVAGSQLGGARVVAVERVAYTGAFTYDLLPSSDTGTYVAEGALVGSTLR